MSEKKHTPRTNSPWWSKLGPGLITGAADDDPSGIATYSQGGAQFGFNVLWTLLLTYPLMVGIQLASARIGRVTGEGLAENFRILYPRAIVYGLVALLAGANIINIGADLNAMGDSAALVLGGSRPLYAVGFGALTLVLQVFIPYRNYVNVLKWFTLSLFAYVGVAFSVHLDWTEALTRAVLPHAHWTKEYTTTVVAIFGTTISPYLFFWQAAQEVEEIGRVKADRPLREAPEQARAQFSRIKLDTVIGMGFSNLIACFVIVSTAATLHAHGITEIDTSAQAANALRPIAGEAAFALFALGIIGTGMLAVPVLAGSAAYPIAALFNRPGGLDRALPAALTFYAILALAMIGGTAISLGGMDPIKALYWSAVINAVISVPIMIAVMLVASSPRIMGKFSLSFKWRVIGWLATATMAAATIAMFATMLQS